MDGTTTTARASVLETPSKNEELTFNDWTVVYKQSHILPSKCTQPCALDGPCPFCFFQKELDMNHLPEMVFPSNELKLTHKSGSSIEFNALDALKCVNKDNLSVKIACSEDWRKAREETGLVDNVVNDFDWTFKSDYQGTYNNWRSVEDTSASIDMEKLRQREEILLYRDLTLFEDELHDNGISVSSVRIRVMPSGFFILLRFFLRVDGVILCSYDSRVYHEFGTEYVLLESTHREGKVKDLQLPIYVMNEPDEVTPLLPLQMTTRKKLVLSKTEAPSD